MSDREVLEARDYWASQGRVRFYERSQHWRRFMARKVAQHAPASVLEFGCNAGRNLVETRELVPDSELVGVDINSDAVAFGVEAYGLDLRVAGEEFLTDLGDSSVDVVFTLSVLDHTPRVEPLFNDLARVARRALLLLEPYTGVVGRTDGGGSESRGGQASTTVAFTYSWDYAALSRRLGVGWRWRWTPYPLSSVNMGPHYWLIEGIRR